MKYTVTWAKAAQDELTIIWMAAPDQQAVTAAANQIDRELLNDAHRKGRPLDNYRILRVEPLAVLFTVSEDDCLARVIEIRRI